MADLSGEALPYVAVSSSAPDVRYDGKHEFKDPVKSSLPNTKLASVYCSVGAGSGTTQVRYYHMVGYNGTNNVGWTVTGSPDFTGAHYSGPGTLVRPTIRVIATWTI
jgi:hypothetical protein